ncbi:MAG: DUF262 domain-containing protein [Candidatus Sericytochromatia bacterium]
MAQEKYLVNNRKIEILLSWVKSGEIAIPEIQRPFVWDATKVRNLMDSLYKGYPIGYLISWRNPNIKLKDGSTSEGKKILIDGQQRVTALMAAILGNNVINKEYKKIRIKIAFNPLEEKFEVSNTAIEKTPEWIPDISEVINNEKITRVVRNYLVKNPNSNEDLIEDSITKLINITRQEIGLIELSPDLDIETVTEIFIRINSEGVVLSQADFAMSKIASNESHNGNNIRKCIDYFCHLIKAPEFYENISTNDSDFVSTDYFSKIKWLKSEHETLYQPDYNDLIRVAFTSEFNRGKLADLVSLLSGRNFETRTYEESIVNDSFLKLEKGIEKFVNENNFKRFLMIIKSAGFISPKLIRSKNSLNFAYILYLKLRSQNYNPAEIESYVRRWFVYSVLTGRYSGSPESTFDSDIKQISDKKFSDYLKSKEEAELSEAFWNHSLVQSLDTSAINSPFFHVFLASQIKNNDKGLFSKEITVESLIKHRGDIHHIFPKDFLKSNGLSKAKYNQIANYVYMQQEINIKVGKKSPKQYFSELKQQIDNEEIGYSGIKTEEDLNKNLEMNCIPENISEMVFEDYDNFLEARRVLMANKIKEFYFSL